MKKIAAVLIVVLLFASQAFAGPTVSELLASPDFANLDAVKRLEVLNQKLTDETMKSSDISGDIISRLFMDAIVTEPDATARLTKYGQLRASYPKLPSCYELERSLAVQYLAANPATKDADDLVRLKTLLQLENSATISWPAAAALYTGILANHLATNQEYQAMSHADRITYIRHLAADGIVKDLTATDFIRGEGMALLSELPPAEQAPALKAMETGLDFFSKNSLTKGYAE